MNLDSFEKVKKLTTEMVNIPSINHAGDGGEAKVAKYVHDFYAKMPYFQEHPEHLLL